MSLPTGFDKSLCYALLPLVFNYTYLPGCKEASIRELSFHCSTDLLRVISAHHVIVDLQIVEFYHLYVARTVILTATQP